MSLMDRRVSVPLGPLIAGVLILLVAALVTWVREAEVRRVGAACETWLDHRGSLDTVIDETDEALGRLREPGDKRLETLAQAYNDADRDTHALAAWVAVAPGLRDEIDDWEVDASQALKHSLSNSRQLLSAMETGPATEAAGHDAELAAENLRSTQEWLRDSCGAAWRRL